MVKTKFTEGMSSLLDSEFLIKFSSFIHKMCHKTASCYNRFLFPRHAGFPFLLRILTIINYLKINKCDSHVFVQVKRFFATMDPCFTKPSAWNTGSTRKLLNLKFTMPGGIKGE